MGTLYYGDNLPILRPYLKDETVDLVYLDPPFNSGASYNAFFQEKCGTTAAKFADNRPGLGVKPPHGRRG
jgi:16S rRNA G966 N2-methylase RsmD